MDNFKVLPRFHAEESRNSRVKHKCPSGRRAETLCLRMAFRLLSSWQYVMGVLMVFFDSGNVKAIEILLGVTNIISQEFTTHVLRINILGTFSYVLNGRDMDTGATPPALVGVTLFCLGSLSGLITDLFWQVL